MADSFLFIPLSGAAGSGDVMGAPISVDGEIALFNGATGKRIKSATGTGVVHTTSGVYSTSPVLLGSEVNGTLPLANGGTNSSAGLSGNRVMVSSGSAIIENGALASGRALVSNGTGLPAASTTTTTELGYVSGVTSLIQPQIDTLTTAVATKVTKVASTDKAVVRFNGTTGDVQNSLVTISDVGDIVTPASITTGSENVTGLLYAQGSFRLPNLTTAQRNALTLVPGLMVYNTSVHTLQVYVAGTVNAWVDALGWGAPTS